MNKKLSRILTGTLSLALMGQIMCYSNETHNTISYAETIEEVNGEALSKETSDYIEQYGEYIGDPELEAYVAKKQNLAEELYQAMISGDNDLACQYQSKMQKIEDEALGIDQQSIEFAKNEKASTSPPPPSSYTINLTHYTQENGYYCGPATALMILKKMGASNITQKSLASSLGTTASGTAWYLSNGDSFSQFPMMQTLNSHQSKKYYMPSPLGNAGANPLSTTKVKSYVVSCTSNGNPSALCGISYSSGNSHLPNYPNEEIGHWLACIGYKSDGSQIYIADPASNYSAKWSNVPQTYYIDAEKCQAFIAPRGIIW